MVSIPRLQLCEALDRTGLGALLVPLLSGLLDLGAEHEDMLVHEGLPEIRPFHGSQHGIDDGHSPLLDPRVGPAAPPAPTDLMVPVRHVRGWSTSHRSGEPGSLVLRARLTSAPGERLHRWAQADEFSWPWRSALSCSECRRLQPRSDVVGLCRLSPAALLRGHG